MVNHLTLNPSSQCSSNSAQEWFPLALDIDLLVTMHTSSVNHHCNLNSPVKQPETRASGSEEDKVLGLKMPVSLVVHLWITCFILTMGEMLYSASD